MRRVMKGMPPNFAPGVGHPQAIGEKNGSSFPLSAPPRETPPSPGPNFPRENRAAPGRVGGNMSAEASLSLIHRYYDLFNAGDRPALLALLDESVVHDINHGASETGRDTFARFLERMDRCYAEQVEELVVMAHDGGERVAAEFFIRGRYLATDDGLPEANGQTYWLRVGAFFEVRDGRILRVTNYYNLTDWLRQIGA